MHSGELRTVCVYYVYESLLIQWSISMIYSCSLRYDKVSYRNGSEGLLYHLSLSDAFEYNEGIDGNPYFRLWHISRLDTKLLIWGINLSISERVEYNNLFMFISTGFTMYATVVIWISFLAIYFGSPYKSVAFALSLSSTAHVALSLMFFHKVCLLSLKIYSYKI